MRVVVISTPIFKFFETGVSGYSGLEHLAWQQAKGLAAKGHNVALVCPDGSVCPGVEIIAIGPERQVDETTAYQRYWESLLSADVIIDSTWLKWSYCLKAEGRIKSPILAVMHAPISTMYEQWPPIFPGLPQVEKACAVCISKDQANRFEVKHNAEARVCYNGVDPEYYRDLGIPRTDRFLFLARFSTIKGPDIALRACKDIGAGLDCIGDTQITGEPDYLAKCKAMADGKQLRILGGASRGECVWWFNQANCLVHPNERFCEPFGLAPVEAMACGTPVVSWRYGAMRETIAEGETGWTVKSYEEFVERLRQIQKDGIPDTMRKRCRQWAADTFSVAKMIDRYDELIKEAVDAPW